MATSTNAIPPSTTGEIEAVLSVCWILSIEPKRDAKSPACRRSKKLRGSRSRCWKRLNFHCNTRLEPATMMAQERTKSISARKASNSPRPSTINVSRSRSLETTTSSSTSWKLIGIARPITSKTNDIANTWVAIAANPSVRRNKFQTRTRARSVFRSKPSVGQLSRTIPVKRLLTSWIGTSRRPTAGSWITMPRRRTRTSTTKWLWSQCRIQGRRSRCR